VIVCICLACNHALLPSVTHSLWKLHRSPKYARLSRTEALGQVSPCPWDRTLSPIPAFTCARCDRPHHTTVVPAPDRRATARERLRFALRWVDGSTAYTRDVSPKGMYVWVHHGARIDDWVSLDFADPRSGLRFKAFGEVLRVEPGVTRTGVAMRLHAGAFVR
jgi:hypothetical protein